MERTSPSDAHRAAVTAIGQHLVPIVIAITGHRDLRAEDVPQLEHSVRDFLLSLRNRYPSSPLRLLSGLAEGADRLVARVALQQSAELVAVLPMPREDYEQDASSPESLQEFQHLLAQACGEIVVDPTSPRQAERVSYYARQGAYLVEHCDILLALWDGEQSTNHGGTADIVRYRLEGVPTEYQSVGGYFVQHVGDVYQMVTSRRSNPVNRQNSGQLRLHTAKPAAQRAVTQIQKSPTLAAIDGLNRCLAGLEPSSEVDAVPTPADSDSGLAVWRERFRLIDSLAIQFQQRTWRAYTLMLICALLAMISLQLQVISPGASQYFQFAYFYLLFAAYVVYGWSKQQQIELKAFDYRALAEGLRIQICWRQAGLNASVADHYLSRQQDVLQWIRRALFNWESHQDARQIAECITPSSLALANEQWIQGQLRFFEKATARQRFHNRCFVGTANGLMVLGVLIGTSKWWPATWTWLFSWSTIPPTIAATLLIYSKTRAWSEQVNQYESMRNLYQVAEKNLQHLLAAGDLPAAKRLLTDLGREALAENTEWLILHRRRPMSSPSLGL